jgi:NDP-sugar pyrophosphorylase family protein
MKAVILAGGLGTRLKPFTEVIPKPLLPVGESSVLEIQILSLARSGFDEIYIATNYMADYIEAFLGNGERYGVRLTFSRETKPLGTCGPLSLLKSELAEPFLLMNGDILTTLHFRDVLDFALDSDADLTVVTKEFVTPFNFGKVTKEGPYIVAIEEKPNFRFEVLAGIYAIKPTVLSLIPDDEYYGMDVLINSMLASHRKVAGFALSGYWLDIGQAEEYETARTNYSELFGHLKKQPGVKD